MSKVKTLTAVYVYKLGSSQRIQSSFHVNFKRDQMWSTSVKTSKERLYMI